MNKEQIDPKDFRKVVNPGAMDAGRKSPSPIFVKIKYKDGKLSLSGVVGPFKNGDCAGSAGQIAMGFKHRDPAHDDSRYNTPTPPEDIRFNEPWNADMWYTLLEYWKLWHLNDMCANCPHQTGPDWDASKKLTVEKFSGSTKRYKLNNPTYKTKHPVKLFFAMGWNNLKALWVNYAIYRAGIVGYGDRGRHTWPWISKFAEKRGYIESKTEEKTAGWVYPSTHPEGILTKPCPVCGYKYGSAWNKEDVPLDVLTWLYSLPNTEVTPAWV